jgi:hypothetical protein
MKKLVEIPNDFLCPITKDLMENPVIAVDTHSYEKEAIIRWLETGRMISPMTGAKLRDRVIIENTTLKKAIQ